MSFARIISVQSPDEIRAESQRRKELSAAQARVAARQRIRRVVQCLGCYRTCDIRGRVTETNYLEIHAPCVACGSSEFSEPTWLDPLSGRLLSQDQYDEKTT